nr:ribonuclease H-like domain-containing protein [Tanacetum cinerariifolium]
MKGIKREYSNARTLQQNEVAKRKNRTLIKAPMTMLADSLLPITFWAEVVNTACYVLNRYSVTSKAFRVFNTRTRKVDENLHVRFLENNLNVAGTGPNWLFDIDSLTNSMNYIPVSVGNQTNKNAGPQDTNSNAGTKDNVNAGKEVSDQHYIVLPLWSSISSTFKSLDDKAADDTPKDDTVDALRKEFELGYMDQRGATKAGSTNSFNTISNPVNVASTLGTFSAGGPSSPPHDAFIPANTLLHVDQDDS